MKLTEKEIKKRRVGAEEVLLYLSLEGMVPRRDDYDQVLALDGVMGVTSDGSDATSSRSTINGVHYHNDGDTHTFELLGEV